MPFARLGCGLESACSRIARRSMGLLRKKEAETEEPPREATQPKKAKAFRIELGWRGMFGLVVICFFLFFWMFVFGIWAGQTILLPSRESRIAQPGEPAKHFPAQTAVESNSAPQPQTPRTTNNEQP
jgi:hypothetical protein